MTPSAILRASVFLLATSPLHAQQPPVELKDSRLWEHVQGPRTDVHLTQSEHDNLIQTRRYIGRESIAFEIVVSANGRVDSATLLDNQDLPPMFKSRADEARALELARTFKPWLQEGNPIRVKIQDFVSMLPPERWATIRVPFPSIEDLSNTHITLTRTVCYGSCPDYSVTIDGDGTVHFSGHRFVAIPGDHTAHIGATAFRELMLAFRASDFFSARDRYQGNWTDNPTQTVTLSLGGLNKTVTDYVGTDDGLPQAIRNLEAQIDETAGTVRWIKAEGNIVELLTAEHWPFKAPSPQNLALYNSAILGHNAALVDQYLATKAPILSATDSQPSPVCTASSIGDDGLVKRMLETVRDAGPPKSLPPSVLNQCLSYAARSGNVAVFQRWIDNGASPTAPPQKVEQDWLSEMSPPANALISGNPEIVRKLLERKVDVHAEVRPGEPLLIWALERSDAKHIAEIVTLLADAGADVNARGNMGETPIFAAHHATQAIRPLLAAGANLEAREDNGNTPLIRYAFMEPAVRELLAVGADPTAIAKNGDTALKTARQYNCPTCASLIEAALAKRTLSADHP